MVTNIFAGVLNPDKFPETFPQSFCLHSISWREDMELARADRIIHPQVTERFLEAASSREPYGKRRRQTGINQSHLRQGYILTGRCDLISIIFLAVWRFIIRQDCWPDLGWVLQLWKHSTRSFSFLLLLRLAQSAPKLSHTQGNDLKIKIFKYF